MPGAAQDEAATRAHLACELLVGDVLEEVRLGAGAEPPVSSKFFSMSLVVLELELLETTERQVREVEPLASSSSALKEAPGDVDACRSSLYPCGSGRAAA